MRSGRGIFIHPEEGCWLARRGQVGMEKGEGGIAAGRKTWQSQWVAGLPALTNPRILQPEGHLSSSVVCSWCCAAPTLQGLFPKGSGRELPGSGLQFMTKTPLVSVGKNWASLDFIPLSAAASVSEKSQPSFKSFPEMKNSSQLL